MFVQLRQIRLNQENFRQNYILLRSQGKPIMPVIKANAYGHGLLDAARLLWREGAGHLAVGSVAEAVQLRLGGFDGVIVSLLGAASDSDVEAIRAYQIVPVVHDWAGLTRLNEFMAGIEASSPSSIALKCDSGMGRLGFTPEDIPVVADFLSAAPYLQPDYLLSHLATADDPAQDEYTKKQAAVFEECLRALRFKFPGVLSSLGNSACLLSFPELAGDLARPGLALYGANPLHGTSREGLGEKLLPALEVSAPILEVHHLEAGNSLGYGRSYTAPDRRVVAVVGIGYADGFRRNPAPGTSLTVRGQRAPLIGRVSMQMICLDISHIPGVKPGENAYVLGGPGQAVTAQELAQWWGTIPYEVMCCLGGN